MLSLVIVAAIITVVACAGCTSNSQSATSTTPPGFVLYTNKDAGVEINYPSDWQVTGNPIQGAIAEFQQGNKSTLQIQTGVLNKSGESAQSLAPALISLVEKSNSTVRLLQNQTASLAGQPGYQIVFSISNPDGTQYKELMTWTVKGASVYMIEFAGPSDLYDQQLSTAQQMIASFRLV